MARSVGASNDQAWAAGDRCGDCDTGLVRVDKWLVCPACGQIIERSPADVTRIIATIRRVFELDEPDPSAWPTGRLLAPCGARKATPRALSLHIGRCDTCRQQTAFDTGGL